MKQPNLKNSRIHKIQKILIKIFVFNPANLENPKNPDKKIGKKRKNFFCVSTKFHHFVRFAQRQDLHLHRINLQSLMKYVFPTTLFLVVWRGIKPL